MPKKSAGIICYRFSNGFLEVLLVHPGGPFWKKKDEGAWSIPKGEYADNEEALAAAIREFEEETGLKVSGKFVALAPVKQKSGKWISAWYIQTDPDIAAFKSNDFTIEWPPRSGKQQNFPEIDRLAWFDLETAKKKVTAGQVPLIAELQERLSAIK